MGSIFAIMILLALGGIVGIMVAGYVIGMRETNDAYDLFWEEDSWDD